jgi:predicted TIM-barrel fold metal-dependent hydrolase|tara:strand:+ start:3158 stop:3376 length:219 start_codon:yes stop_codon:yes gene_type:complete
MQLIRSSLEPMPPEYMDREARIASVIVGSDWPHMEGLEHPRDIFEEIKDIPESVQAKILHDNVASLNQRLGA